MTETQPQPHPKYTVFVSSTKDDLSAERERVVGTILKAGHIPCGMEQFASASERGWGVIADTIDLCDYYLIIVAGMYGSVEPGQDLSWTERELNYALEKGLPVLAFVREIGSIKAIAKEREPERQRKVGALVDRLRGDYLSAEWREPGDLCEAVAHSLVQQIERDHRRGNQRPGWYRGDNLPSLPNAEGWDRCGNIYWLAHNMVGAALHLIQGLPQLVHWKGMTGHAENVPIPSIYVDEIRAVQNATNVPDLRRAQRLVDIAKEIGRLVQSHQVDFAGRDPGPG